MGASCIDRFDQWVTVAVSLRTSEKYLAVETATTEAKSAVADSPKYCISEPAAAGFVSVAATSSRPSDRNQEATAIVPTSNSIVSVSTAYSLRHLRKAALQRNRSHSKQDYSYLKQDCSHFKQDCSYLKQDHCCFNLHHSYLKQERSYLKQEWSHFKQEWSHFKQKRSRFKRERSHFKPKLPCLGLHR